MHGVVRTLCSFVAGFHKTISESRDKQTKPLHEPTMTSRSTFGVLGLSITLSVLFDSNEMAWFPAWVWTSRWWQLLADEYLRWVAIKFGFFNKVNQDLHTNLNRIKDLTGSLKRMFVSISSGKYFVLVSMALTTLSNQWSLWSGLLEIALHFWRRLRFNPKTAVTCVRVFNAYSLSLWGEKLCGSVSVPCAFLLDLIRVHRALRPCLVIGLHITNSLLFAQKIVALWFDPSKK